jgi:hypothetical protein
MTQGVKDLIDAIASGDSLAIDAAFNSEMASRISERLDDMRVDVAQNIFHTESVDELDEAVGSISSGKAQHGLEGDEEKQEHSDYMKKKYNVVTKFHTKNKDSHEPGDDDELSYHGSKENVKKAVKDHYGPSAQADAKEFHPHLFK